MTDELSIALLGGFEVRLDDQPVSRFEYDKARALLAYLAVEADTIQRRDALTALLWPERSDREARHSLSQALLTCRQALGDQERTIPFLLADRRMVQWNPSAPPQLDVRRLERLLSACAAHPHPRAETCAECMARRWAALTGRPVLLADAAGWVSAHGDTGWPPQADRNHDAEHYRGVMDALWEIPQCVGYHLCGAHVRNNARRYGFRDKANKLIPETVDGIRAVNAEFRKRMGM